MDSKQLNQELERLGKIRLRDIVEAGIDPAELDFWPETASIEDMAKYIAACKILAKHLEDRLEVIKSNAHFTSIRLAEVMEEQAMEKFSIKGVASFWTKTDLFASIPADNKEAAFDWLRENGMEELIKETVNGNSLKSAIKGHLEEGGETPDPSIIKIHTQLTVQSRLASKK